jgi:hypothetical protein
MKFFFKLKVCDVGIPDDDVLYVLHVCCPLGCHYCNFILPTTCGIRFLNGLVRAVHKRMGFYVKIVFETILQLVICSSDGHMNESTSGRVIS